MRTELPDKVFYVSPFLDMDMRYAFRVEPPGERIAVAVDGLRDGERDHYRLVRRHAPRDYRCGIAAQLSSPIPS